MCLISYFKWKKKNENVICSKSHFQMFENVSLVAESVLFDRIVRKGPCFSFEMTTSGPPEGSRNKWMSWRSTALTIAAPEYAVLEKWLELIINKFEAKQTITFKCPLFNRVSLPSVWFPSRVNQHYSQSAI